MFRLKLSMGVTFEKFLHQSIQGHARNNPTKVEVLNLQEVVFSEFPGTSKMGVFYGNFLHKSIQSRFMERTCQI